MAAEKLAVEKTKEKALFEIDYNKAVDDSVMSPMTVVNVFSDTLDPDVPCILESFQPAEKILAATEVQMITCQFAGNYKKELGDSLDKRVQQPVWQGNHRQFYHDLWNEVEKQFPQSQVVDPGTIEQNVRSSVHHSLALWP